MKTKNIFILIFILFFLQFSIFINAEISDSNNYLKKNVITKKLSNGITLIMLNRGFAPTLAFEISFRVGSADESYKTIGSAHMLEHMLFKGTDKIGTNNYNEEKILLKKIEAIGETLDIIKLSNPKNILIKDLELKLKKLQVEHSKYIVNSPYDRIYTENGGVGFNASTSRDKTGYYIELPSEKLELWAQVESERLRNPVLREYYLERNNVIQERLMRYDSSGTGSLFEKYIATAFTAHPYRHPTIGWKSNIPFLSIKDIKKFYYNYYIPSRMTITIIGMQNTDQTFQVIEKYFGKLKTRSQRSEIAIKEVKQNGEKRFKLFFESNPYLITGWHKPTYPSQDDYICDIISEILTGGKSSRLYKSLVLDKKIASSISSWNGGPGARYNNMLLIFATPKSPYSCEELEEAIYEEIDKMINDVSKEEIQKVINKLESEMIFGLSSNKGIARLLSYYQTIFKDWRYSLGYIDIIKGITVTDIKNTARKYLIENNRVVGVLKDNRNGKVK